HGVDPQIYFADVLTKLVNLWPASRLDELIPWTWAAERSPKTRGLDCRRHPAKSDPRRGFGVADRRHDGASARAMTAGNRKRPTAALFTSTVACPSPRNRNTANQEILAGVRK